MVVSFISIAFVVVKVCIFKSFLRSRKYKFGLLLDGFSVITPQNEVQLQMYKYSTNDLLQGNRLHILRFLMQSWNLQKLSQKLIFWLIFGSFSITPSYTLSELHPKFYAKWKVSWRRTIVVSFIFRAFVVGKLWNLKCFRGYGASMKWPIFGGFWVLTPPNMVRSCWNLHQSWYSRTVKHCLKTFSKFKFLRK